MCLIVLAWKTHPDYPLLLLANRDEAYARPTAPLHAWETQPVMYAGEDLSAHGSWLGMTAQGRFAAVTNLRGIKPTGQSEPQRSRGHLVRDFLLSRRDPSDYLDHVQADAAHYQGFNLLVANLRSLMYFSNQPGVHPRLLTPGIYGLSNAGLNTSWPKLEEAKVAFSRLIAKRDPDFGAMLELMHSQNRYPVSLLPDTGIGTENEQALSSIFVKTPEYGTRSTTLMTWHRQGAARLLERSYSTPEQYQDTELEVALQPR